MWSGHHLISLDAADASQARELLSLAHTENFAGNALNGRSIAHLFFEDSTRTRLSFSLAAQQLGADLIEMMGKGSSISKGETLVDTALNIEAMGVDGLVVRAAESGSAQQISERVDIPVINAGDGTNQHPTQALADGLTIGRAFEMTSDWDFSGLRIAIVGDVVSSRVAGSNIGLLCALGAQVVLVGPRSMVPDGAQMGSCEIVHDLDAVISEVDAAMMLRVQFERGSGDRLGSKEDYCLGYQLTSERAGRMKSGAIVMHPGPMNRGLEIVDEVADGDRSKILDQVRHGVLVRKAALITAMSR
jgi:aspartate carbamoyltransferase catalytic subunit